MVTFDKGGRVPRLEPGVVLDDRQVGILLAQTRSAPTGEGRHLELLDWDRAHNPGATARLDETLAQKGPAAKQTLLLALSMGVLRRFAVHDPEAGQRAVLEGRRGQGYQVARIDPL